MKRGESAGPLSGTSEASGRVFPCEACGADLTFDISAQRLKCQRCDFERHLDLSQGPPVAEQDLHASFERLRVQRTRPAEAAQQELQCEACGANIRFSGTLTSSECEYCGAPRQLGGVHQAADRVAVDGVLPFQVEQRRARQSLADWVRSRWFAPSEFVRRGVDGRFSGVYLPYWTFDAMSSSWYSGQRGDAYYVTVQVGGQERRERRVRWSNASGAFQRFFDDVLVPAAQALPPQVVRALEPWPMDQVVPYTQQVLSGYLAQTYDVELEQGFAQGRARMEEDIRREVRARIGGDEQRIERVRTVFDALTFKHLLLPVWMLTYRYGGKPYRVMVNGATGEVQGERPYSALKITLAVLAGLILLVIILSLDKR